MLQVYISGKRDNSGLADALEEVFDFAAEGGQLRYWNGRYWSAELSVVWTAVERVLRQAGEKYSAHKKKEVKDILTDRHAKPQGWFNSNREIVPFANGYLNFDTWEFSSEPSQDFGFTFCLNANYNPDATCDGFEKFLSEVLPEAEAVKLAAFFGYALTPKVSLDLALFMVGHGSNGKTMLINALREVMGKEATCEIELQHLDDRFNRIRLMGKLADICDDLPLSKMHDDGFFKKAVTGHELPGEHKGGQIVDFTNTCKFVFTTNELPTTNFKETSGFWRRWLIIRLQRKFAKNAAKKEALTKMFKEERDGIALFLLKTFKRNIPLLESISEQDAIEAWKGMGGSIQQFFQACGKTNLSDIGQEEGDTYDKSPTEVYQTYVEWCRDKGLEVKTQKAFGSEMARLGVAQKRTSQGFVYVNLYLPVKGADGKWMEYDDDLGEISKAIGSA